MQIDVPFANHFPFALDISKLVASVVIKDSLLFGSPNFKDTYKKCPLRVSLCSTGIVILNKVYFYFT